MCISLNSISDSGFGSGSSSSSSLGLSGSSSFLRRALVTVLVVEVVVAAAGMAGVTMETVMGVDMDAGVGAYVGIVAGVGIRDLCMRRCCSCSSASVDIGMAKL